MFSVVVTAEHELEQSVPAVPVFTLGMSLSPRRSGKKGHRAGNAFAKALLTLHSWRQTKFCRRLDLGCYRELEERKDLPPALSFPPPPSQVQIKEP